MDPDIRIIALQSAALRLEHLIKEGLITDPETFALAKQTTTALRSKIASLQAAAPNP